MPTSVPGCCFFFYKKKLICTVILVTSVPFLFVGWVGGVSSFVIDSNVKALSHNCLGADLLSRWPLTIVEMWVLAVSLKVNCKFYAKPLFPSYPSGAHKTNGCVGCSVCSFQLTQKEIVGFVSSCGLSGTVSIS